MEALDSSLPCRLDGRDCPGPECPFWISGDCLIADVDLRGRADIVFWLLDIRKELADATR